MRGKVYQDVLHPNVIVLEMPPAPDWMDISAMFDEEKAMATEAKGSVAVIMDVRNSPEPPSADTLSRSRHMFAAQPRNVACWVLVGSGSMGNMMATVLRTAHVVRMFSANTMEEAHALIEPELARANESIDL